MNYDFLLHKKRLVCIMVLIFICSGLVPVLALTGTSISQEDAIKVVKDIVDTTSYDRFNINYNERKDNEKVWELSWSNTKAPYGSLNASVDANTGNILNFYIYKGYDSDKEVPLIPKYNEDEAKKIAKAYAMQLQPDEFAKTTLSKREEPIRPLEGSSYSDSYNFNFIRVENDIFVEGNGINIRVDGRTGDVENYSFTWSWEPLPPVENLVSLEDANKVFSDEVGLKLIYKRYFDYGTQTENIKLVYVLEDAHGVLIDAATGKLLDDEYFAEYAMGAKNESMKVMYDGGFTPIEIKEVEITKNCISKEEATDIVRKYFSIQKEYKLNSANLYEDYQSPDEKVWNLEWQKTDKGDEGGFVHARINAINSELLSYSFYDYGKYSKDFNQKYDRKSAQNEADEFLKKFHRNRFENVRLEDEKYQAIDSDKILEHNFIYTRFVNEIPYTSNGFNLTVDAENGQIIMYQMLWHDRDFPNPDGVLIKEDVDARFLEDVGLELVYTPLYSSKEQKSKYALVYKIKPAKSMIFDAFSFEPLDYNGKPIEQETKTAFSDIKGHWAEKDIQLLVDLGIIKSTADSFRPDDYIMEGDFIKYLMIAKNQRISDGMPIPIIRADSVTDSGETEIDEDIQKYIDKALKLGWVKQNEIVATNFLSREKASAIVIRSMGFDKVASIPDIFKQMASDDANINVGYKGHVSLAVGLELLSIDGGNFKPKAHTTRAQAATILVRMLTTDS